MRQRLFPVLSLLLLAACDAPEPAPTAATPSSERPEAGHGHEDAPARGEAAAHEREGHAEEEEGVVVLSPEAAARVRIETRPTAAADVDGVLVTTGRVGFDEDRLAHVSPRIAGRAARVDASLGDRVEAGDVLAVLDALELGQAKAELLRTRARVALTRKTYAREKRLHEARISSEQALLEAEAAHRAAQADLAAAEARLHLLGLSDPEIARTKAVDARSSRFPLRAPIAGSVVEKHVTLGEMVPVERTVFTVADLGRVWIWIDVFEGDLSRVHLGDDAQVTVDAWPDRTFGGRIRYLRDQVDPDARTVRARIEVDNPDGLLKPGMFAKVTLTDPHRQAGDVAAARPAVPPSAVQRDGEGFVAFVKTGERRYERRAVVPGRRTPAWIEILDGLAPGEEVVVEGAFLLRSEAAKHEMGGGHSH